MEDVGGAIGAEVMVSTWAVEKHGEKVVKGIPEITGYKTYIES